MMEGMGDTKISLFERILELPVWLGMIIRGDRFDAHPLDQWWNSCPICGRSFHDHRIAPLGACLEPWDDFVSAVENRDWGRAVRDEDPGRLLGSGEAALAVVLGCPTGRLAVLVYTSPSSVTGVSVLLSNQILSDGLAQVLLSKLGDPRWRPAISDRLERIRGVGREMRRRKRSNQTLTRK